MKFQQCKINNNNNNNNNIYNIYNIYNKKSLETNYNKYIIKRINFYYNKNKINYAQLFIKFSNNYI